MSWKYFPVHPHHPLLQSTKDSTNTPSHLLSPCQTIHGSVPPSCLWAGSYLSLNRPLATSVLKTLQLTPAKQTYLLPPRASSSQFPRECSKRVYVAVPSSSASLTEDTQCGEVKTWLWFSFQMAATNFVAASSPFLWAASFLNEISLQPLTFSPFFISPRADWSSGVCGGASALWHVPFYIKYQSEGEQEKVAFVTFLMGFSDSELAGNLLFTVGLGAGVIVKCQYVQTEALKSPLRKTQSQKDTLSSGGSFPGESIATDSQLPRPPPPHPPYSSCLQAPITSLWSLFLCVPWHNFCRNIRELLYRLLENFTYYSHGSYNKILKRKTWILVLRFKVNILKVT